MGLRAIKAEGGLTFVQDEQSAKFNGMPKNAIASGAVDFILPPNKIAHEIVRISNHPYLAFPQKGSNVEPSHEEKEDKHLSHIFKKLQISKGTDFTNYKTTTIQRRITRRMILHKKK